MADEAKEEIAGEVTESPTEAEVESQEVAEEAAEEKEAEEAQSAAGDEAGMEEGGDESAAAQDEGGEGEGADAPSAAEGGEGDNKADDEGAESAEQSPAAEEAAEDVKAGAEESEPADGEAERETASGEAGPAEGAEAEAEAEEKAEDAAEDAAEVPNEKEEQAAGDETGETGDETTEEPAASGVDDAKDDVEVAEGAAVGEQGDSDAEEDDQDGAEQGEEGEEGGQEEGGEEAGDGEGETGEGLGDSEEEEDAPLDPVSPGVNERDVIKNLLAEAYEEENELKEVSKDLEQKILLLERFKTRRGSVIGLTSSIVHDIEARYMSSLLSWSDYMQEEARIAQHYQTALMDLRMRLEDKDKKAIKLEEEYAVFKEEVIKMAEYSRTGKGIPNHVVNEVNLLEDEKEIEKSKVRSRNIHLQHQLKELENGLKRKEELAEGLHLIDLEQLKIENQSLNEKIEERNEELLKLRKKTTTTVQVLTHLKEKLQFVQKKNNILESELGDLDMQLSSKRDKLQREKQSREKARDDIMKLREKSGLVTDPVLLQDVEKQKQKREFLVNKVDELQQKLVKLDTEITFTSTVS